MAEKRTRQEFRESPTDHVIRRAFERYDRMKIGARDVRLMERAIAEGKSVLIRREPGGAEKHMVKCRDRTVLVIWNPTREIIKTMLPPDDLTKRRHDEGKRRALPEERRRRNEDAMWRVARGVTHDEGEDHADL